LKTKFIVIVLIILSITFLTEQKLFSADQSEFMDSVERYRKRIREDQKNLKLHREMIKYAQKTDRIDVPFYIYKESYKEHPNHPVVLYVLGYTYLIDGKKESLEFAEEYLSKAIEENPRMADAYAALGTCYLKQGRIQEAGEKLKNSLRLNTKLVPGYIGLGDYYRTKGKFDKAIKSFNFALEFNPESFEAILGLGITYFMTKNYDTAINKLNLAITLDETSSDAHRFLGKAYALSGKPEMAIKEYELIAEKNSNESSIWYELANLFLDNDNQQYAIQAMQKALSLKSISLSKLTISEAASILEDVASKYPNDTGIHNFLGRLYLKLDNTKSAKEHLEKVKELEPGNTDVRMELGKIYEQENETEKAENEYQEAAQLGSTDTSVLEKVADKYLENNEIDKFITTAEKILAINSKNADMRYKLSIAYQQKHDRLKKENAEPDKIVKQYDLAVEHCKKAVELDTANFKYHLRLADLYAKEGKLKALREYKDAIELAPENPLGYYHRARFMANFKFGGGFLLWAPEDILNDIQKAISLDPKLAGAYSVLGKIYDRMNEFDKALEAYEKAVSIDPSLIEAQLYLAEKYAEKKPQKAIEAYKNAIDAGVDDVEVLKDYAFVILKYYEQTKWKKAQDALKIALEKAPNDQEVLMNYGYTLYLEDKYSEAIEYYKKVLTMDPNHLRTLQNLAVAYEHLGQREEALEVWKRLFRLDPNGKFGYAASKRIEVLNDFVKPQRGE